MLFADLSPGLVLGAISVEIGVLRFLFYIAFYNYITNKNLYLNILHSLLFRFIILVFGLIMVSYYGVPILTVWLLRIWLVACFAFYYVPRFFDRNLIWFLNNCDPLQKKYLVIYFLISIAIPLIIFFLFLYLFMGLFLISIALEFKWHAVFMNTGANNILPNLGGRGTQGSPVPGASGDNGAVGPQDLPVPGASGDNGAVGPQDLPVPGASGDNGAVGPQDLPVPGASGDNGGSGGDGGYDRLGKLVMEDGKATMFKLSPEISKVLTIKRQVYDTIFFLCYQNPGSGGYQYRNYSSNTYHEGKIQTFNKELDSSRANGVKYTPSNIPAQAKPLPYDLSGLYVYNSRSYRPFDPSTLYRKDRQIFVENPLKPGRYLQTDVKFKAFKSPLLLTRYIDSDDYKK